MKLPLHLFILPAAILVLSSSVSARKVQSKAPDEPEQSFIHNQDTGKWQNDWSKENTVVYHWKAEPDNMHPTNGKSNPRRVLMDYTQRFLVNADMEKLVIRPDLAQKLPDVSADGLTYTYELRNEATWDDGSPLTVDDIEFTMKASRCEQTNNAHARPYFDALASFIKDPANPKKFSVKMKYKYILNVAIFGDMPIMQRKFFDPENILGKYSLQQMADSVFRTKTHYDIQKWADEFNNAKYGRDINYLNGLGAYKITAWIPKERIELTKKTNHWTSKLKNPDMYNVAYPEKITFKIIVDDKQVMLDLINQKIDASTWISTYSLEQLQKESLFTSNYHSAFVPNFDYQYFGMNLKADSVGRQPFFTDKKVRKAMALLVPIDKINQLFFNGRAIRMTSMVSPYKASVYNSDLNPVPFDVEKAKKLLDEAGWIDTDGDNVRDKMIGGKKIPFDFELMMMQGNPITRNIGDEVKESMKLAGIKCNIRVIEFATFYEEVQQHKFDMYMGAWSGTFAPEDYKQIWHSSNWANGASNYVGFGTPQTDALIDSIRVTLDESVRIPMEKRLQEIVYEEQPYVFMFTIPRKIVIHKRFGHADMYYEKPGILLSNLKLRTP